MLLPKLQDLQLGNQAQEGSAVTIDAAELAAFIAGRKASSRGLSEGEVALSANGSLSACEREISGEPAFEPEETCCQITKLVVKAPVKSEEVVKAWIQKNLGSLDVHWV